MQQDPWSGGTLGEALAAQAAQRLAGTPAWIAPLTGCLLGTAVGDALGLPVEGLAPRRARRFFGQPDRYHLLPFGRGMCSDDTEHTVMVAQALVESAGYAMTFGDADVFRSKLAWSLRFWLLGLPAGIGLATLRGILKLWLFVPTAWQGVYSAGNGPAMRSALIGVFWGEHPELLRLHVRASTRLTHTDPKAEQSALAVAQAAWLACQHGGRVVPADYAAQMRGLLGAPGAELAALIDRAAASVQAGETTPAFAASLDLARGVSGYALDTVPVALHAWLAHPGDFRGAVLAAIECGGDTDTVAAVVGGIAGAGCGPAGIPAPWLTQLAEWPRTVGWMEHLGLHLAQVRSNYVGMGALYVSPPRILLRNLAFMFVVLAHGLRRLLPPY